ncbi:MAG: hypothetical protein ACM3VY_00215 [Candidatus Bathyarchaeota archaeon]
MTISWVGSLLCRWGRWAVRKELKALGYGSQCQVLKGWSGKDGYGSEVPTGYCLADIQACDRAVAALPVGIRAVVIEHYQRQGSVRATAVACGFAPKAVTQYLDRAHGLIARHIEEERAGAQM